MLAESTEGTNFSSFTIIVHFEHLLLLHILSKKPTGHCLALVAVD